MLFKTDEDGFLICPTCGSLDVDEIYDTLFQMSYQAGDDDTCMSEFVQCVDCGTWEEV